MHLLFKHSNDGGSPVRLEVIEDAVAVGDHGSGATGHGRVAAGAGVD
jgi:hypothetical protein